MDNVIIQVFRHPVADNFVVSGGIWPNFELIQALSTSLLPTRLTKIQLKMKSLQWPQHFSHFKSMGNFLDAQGQLKGTATLMIRIFYNEKLYKAWISIPVSSKSVENGEVVAV